MNVITGRVKSEAGKPIPQFCNTCFSVDRRLYHAGHLLDTLNNLFKHSTTELAFQPVSVCWECRAVLQRVRDFKMNVVAVQQFFCRHQYDQTLRLPPPLSRLSKVRANTEICIKHGVKLEREVQKGSPLVKDQPEHATVEIEVDVKREVKADSDDGHWQNDEVESKQTSPKPALRDDWYRNTSKPSGSQIKQETPTQTPSKPVKTDSLKTDLNPAQINHWYKKQTKPKPSEYKYIRRIESNLCMEKFYTKFPVDSVQLDKLLEDDRKDKLFTALPHRCNRCICGWRIKKNLETHNKSRHSESAGPYQCDICTRRMLGKNRIRLHVKAHYVARKCNMCEYKTATQSSMRRHILKNHYKSVECRTCGAFFRSTRDFHYHYKTLHRRFVCDHCGRSCITRDAIEKHLVLHGPFLCCGRQFPSYRAMKDHRTHYHSSRGPPELSYCVECNKQFDSVARFKKHLATAVVHRDPNKPSRPSKKPAPCPDCGKVYARMHSMRDHYNFEHLGWSNYKCQVCDVYFRNRTIYKHHMLSRHEPGWKPPRDKICSECGRGFTSSEVLKKHIRTHTGERPYACSYCDAAFAQSTALKSHVRHIHLKERRTPASQMNNASS